MPKITADEILELLLAPETLATRPESFWSDAVPRLRQGGLLGRLACENRHVWPELPPAIRDQFEAAAALADHQRVVIENDLRFIGDVLQLKVPVVLLKGAAYEAMRTPNALGRMSCDIDIMVPVEAIQQTEHLLHHAGWTPVETTEYDEYYFRSWMHEIPPLRHPERGTFIDLHHSIVPPVSRLNVDVTALFEAARPIPDWPFLSLCPEDMVLHSARHLLGDGEFEHGLRDLYDMFDLLTYFSQAEPDFWERLHHRSELHHLERCLYYVVSILRRSFGLELPIGAWKSIDGARPLLFGGAMNKLIEHGMLFGDRRSTIEDMSALVLWARSHYLRMPLRLLIPHLVRKTAIRLRASMPRALANAEEQG